VCVIINNSSFPTVKNNNTAYHAFGIYWMQARGLRNYRLNYCWPKVIYCTCQPNELEREIKKKSGVAKQKSGGAHGQSRPPLRIATGLAPAQTWRPPMEDFLETVLPRPADTGGNSGAVPQIFCDLPNFDVLRKICSKHMIKTKIFPP